VVDGLKGFPETITTGLPQTWFNRAEAADIALTRLEEFASSFISSILLLRAFRI
jgi:hypothetical protein